MRAVEKLSHQSHSEESEMYTEPKRQFVIKNIKNRKPGAHTLLMQ